MKQLLKLIDVKSIVTLTLVFCLVYLVVTNTVLDEKLSLLFSNILSMTITYFFTKKSSSDEKKE